MLSAYMLGVHCSRIFSYFVCIFFFFRLLLFIYFVFCSCCKNPIFPPCIISLYFYLFILRAFHLPVVPFVYLFLFALWQIVVAVVAASLFFAWHFYLLLPLLQSNLFHLNTFSSRFVFHFRCGDLATKMMRKKPTWLKGNV